MVIFLVLVRAKFFERPKSSHNTPSKRYTLQVGQVSQAATHEMKKSTSEGQVPKMGRLGEDDDENGKLGSRGKVVLDTTGGEPATESSEEDVEEVVENEDEDEEEHDEVASLGRGGRKLEREHSDPPERSMRMASPRRPDGSPPTSNSTTNSNSTPTLLGAMPKSSISPKTTVSNSPKLPTKYVAPMWSTRNKSQREIRLNLAPAPAASAPPKELAGSPSSARMVCCVSYFDILLLKFMKAARLVNGKWVVSAPDDTSPRRASAGAAVPTALEVNRTQRLKGRFEKDASLVQQPSSSTSS